MAVNTARTRALQKQDSSAVCLNHLTRSPVRIVAALVFDGARDAVAFAEAATRPLRAPLHSLWQAHPREPERVLSRAKANLGAGALVGVLGHGDEAALGRVDLDHVRQRAQSGRVRRVVLVERLHCARYPAARAADVADDAVELCEAAAGGEGFCDERAHSPVDVRPVLLDQLCPALLLHHAEDLFEHIRLDVLDAAFGDLQVRVALHQRLVGHLQHRPQHRALRIAEVGRRHHPRRRVGRVRRRWRRIKRRPEHLFHGRRRRRRRRWGSVFGGWGWRHV
mmetsp:Transcript_705/g.2078  ORF Transcript_705/g.2078 Transcript_705/m.2078 type:complete len:280 (+) Transcript_705:175-1014(+)